MLDNTESCAVIHSAASRFDLEKEVVRKMEKDYSEDTKSIDSIIAATYAVISGGKGEPRDWERFRNLFHKDGRLIPSSRDENGLIVSIAHTPDQYIARSEKFLLEKGFFEYETERKTDTFGPIAQAFSRYEGRYKLDDPAPFLTGINSFQLMNDGKRWWVVSILWIPEHEIGDFRV
ncbi:MAG: hypothetical protein R2684_04640 [Pyrinomonadaceae bacterium]